MINAKNQYLRRNVKQNNTSEPGLSQNTMTNSYRPDSGVLPVQLQHMSTKAEFDA